MKKVILSLILAGSVSSEASQMFHCESADHVPVELILNSFTELEYSNDWDFDGTYELVSGAKGQMWKTFRSTDEYLSSVEIQVQGKLFHGKPGWIKEILHSVHAQDGKQVLIFKCAPGQMK